MTQDSTQSTTADWTTRDSDPLEALKSQVDTIGKDVRELGTLARAAAADGVSRTRDSGAELVATARDKVSEYEETFVRSMRANPMRTMLYAAGVGFAVGLLARR